MQQHPSQLQHPRPNHPPAAIPSVSPPPQHDPSLYPKGGIQPPYNGYRNNPSLNAAVARGGGAMGMYGSQTPQNLASGRPGGSTRGPPTGPPGGAGYRPTSGLPVSQQLQPQQQMRPAAVYNPQQRVYQPQINPSVMSNSVGGGKIAGSATGGGQIAGASDNRQATPGYPAVNANINARGSGTFSPTPNAYGPPQGQSLPASSAQTAYVPMQKQPYASSSNGAGMASSPSIPQQNYAQPLGSQYSPSASLMTPVTSNPPMSQFFTSPPPSARSTPPVNASTALYGGGSATQPPDPGSAADWQRRFGVNDATAQIGMQLGKNAFETGQAYVERNLARVVPLSHVRYSFNVSTSYVAKKLLLVIWPWRHKPWTRAIRRTENGVPIERCPPSEDINCPDLYIPTMAITTYILLAAFIAGIRGDFHPEILGRRASTSIGLLTIEYLCVKLGCYLFSISDSGTVLELMAYEGYKFVGVVLVKLAGLLGARGWLYWLILFYMFCADMFFLLRSLRHLVLPDPVSSLLDHSSSMAPQPQLNHAQRSRRVQFLFGIALAQGISMTILALA